QDALIAVMDHLSDFRGDSKFSTWAYKFAINIAMMAARHERWKGVSLDQLAASAESHFFDSIRQDKSDGSSPEQSAMQTEIQRILQEVIEYDLTENQRRVVFMMI